MWPYTPPWSAFFIFISRRSPPEKHSAELLQSRRARQGRGARKAGNSHHAWVGTTLPPAQAWKVCAHGWKWWERGRTSIPTIDFYASEWGSNSRAQPRASRWFDIKPYRADKSGQERYVSIPALKGEDRILFFRVQVMEWQLAGEPVIFLGLQRRSWSDRTMPRTTM